MVLHHTLGGHALTPEEGYRTITRVLYEHQGRPYTWDECTKLAKKIVNALDTQGLFQGERESDERVYWSESIPRIMAGRE